MAVLYSETLRATRFRGPMTMHSFSFFYFSGGTTELLNTQ
jgi:hypothetical protein